MDTFKAVIGAWLGIISAVILDYLLKFRPGLSEKFVLKLDCQRDSDQLHNENRQDHQLMFEEIKGLRTEIVKIQTMIIDKK